MKHSRPFFYGVVLSLICGCGFFSKDDDSDGDDSGQQSAFESDADTDTDTATDTVTATGSEDVSGPGAPATG